MSRRGPSRTERLAITVSIVLILIAYAAVWISAGGPTPGVLPWD